MASRAGRNPGGLAGLPQPHRARTTHEVTLTLTPSLLPQPVSCCFDKTNSCQVFLRASSCLGAEWTRPSEPRRGKEAGGRILETAKARRPGHENHHPALGPPATQAHLEGHPHHSDGAAGQGDRVHLPMLNLAQRAHVL